LKTENIHPVFDKLVQRGEKEKSLNQRARVLWFTGLSGSGKTTIAVALEKKLHENGFFTQLLDGDNVRTGINNNLKFSYEDRMENIRRIAEVSKLFLNCGVITIDCFVSPSIEMRKMAKDIIGAKDFTEIYVNTPLEICEERDVKGLYAKARKGEIKDFTGIGDGYEAPVNADLEIKTENRSVEECVDEIYKAIEEKIKLK
jgi:adenylylsulfate kinase